MDFNISPAIDVAPGSFFEPSSWLVKIDFINQFITKNRVLISILGEQGSGKTTFIDLLKRKLNSEIETLVWSAIPLFDKDACLAQLAQLFDLASLNSLDELKKIVDGRQVEILLVIDNAEQLSEAFICEMLDVISKKDAHTYLHFCIVSDFSLVKTTSRLARETYPELIHSIELQPLSQEETKDYVIEKMDWSKDQALDIPSERFKQFYDLTEGNLVGINSQLHAFFSHSKPGTANANSHSYFSYGMVVIAAFSIIGIAMVAHHQTPSDGC